LNTFIQENKTIWQALKISHQKEISKHLSGVGKMLMVHLLPNDRRQPMSI
jgi:hypothetical protein